MLILFRKYGQISETSICLSWVRKDNELISTDRKRAFPSWLNGNLTLRKVLTAYFGTINQNGKDRSKGTQKDSALRLVSTWSRRSLRSLEKSSVIVCRDHMETTLQRRVSSDRSHHSDSCDSDCARADSKQEPPDELRRCLIQVPSGIFFSFEWKLVVIRIAQLLTPCEYKYAYSHMRKHPKKEVWI